MLEAHFQRRQPAADSGARGADDIGHAELCVLPPLLRMAQGRSVVKLRGAGFGHYVEGTVLDQIAVVIEYFKHGTGGGRRHEQEAGCAQIPGMMARAEA